MNSTRQREQIRDSLREFILAEFLPGEDAAFLEPDTPLFSSGILDSIDTAKLALFLEERFDITLRASQLQEETFGTVDAIVELVQTRQSGTRGDAE